VDPALYSSAAAKFSDGSSQRTTGRVLMILGGTAPSADEPPPSEPDLAKK
jgi:hypothetical protein